MATYQKPTENLIAFNSSVFKTANESTLTLSEAQALFLGRTGTPSSTATATTFNGTVNGLTLSSGSIGTRVGTGSGLGNQASNMLMIGDGLLGGNTPSYTNNNVMVGENIGTGGDLQYNTLVGLNIYKTGNGYPIGNTIMGYNTSNKLSGNYTVALGHSSAYTNTSGGNYNVSVGYNSLYANTTGSANVAIGYNAFQTGATFTNSTAIGATTVIGASTSTAIGYGATTSVANQIVLGTATEFVSCPGTSATNGSLTTAGDIYVNGVRAGAGLYRPVTDASMNTCFGRNALGKTTTAIMNTAVGNTALAELLTGVDNSAVGNKALNALTSGQKNVAVGANSLVAITTGSRNTAIGQGSGQVLATSASDNTFLGYLAGAAMNAIGNHNTFIGQSAGVLISTAVSGNTFVGSGAGRAAGGVPVNSTGLGYNATCNFSTSTVIGYNSSASAANQIMLGTATETVYCVGVPTTGSTTYTSLVLSGGLQLQSAYSTTPTSNMLGFQLTNTTGFTIASFTSASPTNISSAGIDLTAGVWNIDYSIELSIATATATVSAQTLFCSLTTNGVYATQRISNSGITRIHSHYTYASGDTPAFSGSFNYYVSSATTVYPIFQITFTGGSTISGVGFYKATRIG